MRSCFALVAASVIALKLMVPAAAADTYASSTDVKKIAWMDRGMSAVRAKLRDPKSAEFKDVFFSLGKKNIPVTCGLVNSKNGFGGYAGFQRFVSAGRPDLTFLEGEVRDFQQVWDQLC